MKGHNLLIFVFFCNEGSAKAPLAPLGVLMSFERAQLLNRVMPMALETLHHTETPKYQIPTDNSAQTSNVATK